MKKVQSNFGAVGCVILAVRPRAAAEEGTENHPQRFSRNKRSAFTLTELLVVVAIIGILAALLFTALSAAKKRSQLIQCVHNLHQQGLGLQEFVTDYHYYPLEYNPNYLKGAYREGGLGWAEAVARRELGTKSVLRCPAAVHWSYPLGGGGSTQNIDYGYNSDGLVWIGPQGANQLDSLGLGGLVSQFSKANKNDGSTAPPVSPSEVAEPSDMLAIGDGFAGNASLICDDHWNLSRNRDLNGASDFFKRVNRWIHARHQDRANIVFCDGHVETLTFKFLLQDTNNAALACWNRDHLTHREELSR